jgi:hypothetical protein
MTLHKYEATMDCWFQGQACTSFPHLCCLPACLPACCSVVVTAPAGSLDAVLQNPVRRGQAIPQKQTQKKKSDDVSAFSEVED